MLTTTSINIMSKLHSTVKYDRLKQYDDSDDEVVLFQEPLSLLERNLTESYCTRKRILILAIIIVCIGVVLGVYLFPFYRPETEELLLQSNLTTSEWTITVDGLGSESCVVVYDIDEDGRQDFMFGAVVGNLFPDDIPRKMKEVRQTCHERKESFPCGGQIQGRRGYDGSLLWTVPTYMGVYTINCDNIDVDLDGKTDCIGTGRMGTIIAFNPRNGTVLWDVLHSKDTRRVMNDVYNTYNALVLPDLDGDGVKEVLVMHGGDPTVPAKVQTRQAGRLLLLSGQTGELLGKNNHYMTVPDNKESYNSPILHTKKDGAQHVLFGHGGETVPGSLLAISVKDLYTYLMGEEINSTGSYIKWMRKTRHPNNVIEIYKSDRKGVIVPPVLYDWDKDGTDDILMSAFDGTYALYNGETLDEIWSTRSQFSEYESYRHTLHSGFDCSTPALGYFNDDAHLDFMVHLCYGEWPSYPFTLAVIFDGQDGSVLWSANSSVIEITSDLVLRTPESHRDAFVFRTKGRNEKHTGNMNHGLYHQYGEMAGLKDQNSTGSEINNTSSTNGTKAEETPVLCEVADLRKASPHTTELFLMDRSLSHNPILIDSKVDRYFYYNVTEEDREIALKWHTESNAFDKKMRERYRTPRGTSIKSHNMPPMWQSPLCTLLEIYEANTGAIADFDGDGHLDLVIIYSYIAELMDDYSLRLRQHFTNEVKKYNLHDVVHNNHQVTMDTIVHKSYGETDKALNKMDFSQFSSNEWFQYLGKGSRSRYSDF